MGFQTKQTEDTGKRCIYWPTVGDVYKTTYKTGTIDSFKELSTDPYTVVSQVKVNINGKVSDYIPIFYKPKLGFWDSHLQPSQDFNTWLNFYSNAWMSFRGGDEVIIQCCEDKPVAVVGFADGIPRLGEALINLEGKTVHTETDVDLYLNAADQSYWPDEVGPDGKPLNLLKEAECIYHEQSVKTRTYYFRYEGLKDFKPEPWMYEIDHCNSHSEASVETKTWEEVREIIWGPVYMTFAAVHLVDSHHVEFRYPKVSYTWLCRTHHYLVVVGPLMYVIQILSVKMPERSPEFVGYDMYSQDSTEDHEGEYGWVSYLVAADYPPAFGTDPPLWEDYTLFNAAVDTFNEGAEQLNALFRNQREYTCQLQTEGVNRIKNDWGCNDPWKPEGKIILVEIAAAPFTPELYEATKQSGHANYASSSFIGKMPDIDRSITEFYTTYSGFVHQTRWVESLDIDNEGVLPNNYPKYMWQYQWDNTEINKSLEHIDGIDMDTVSVYERPHTKQEIEELLGGK